MDIYKILPHRHERARDEVDIVLDAELYIRLILLGQVYLLQVLSGKTHGFAVRKFSACEDFGLKPDTVRADDLELEKCVVQEYPVARLQLIGKVVVADRDDVLIALDLFSGEDKIIAFIECDFAVPESAYTELRSLGVEHYRYRQPELFPDLLYPVYTLQMLLVRAVREVQPRNVHARQAQLLQRLFRLTRRPYRTYYLGLSHMISLSFSVPLIPCMILRIALHAGMVSYDSRLEFLYAI